MWIVIDRDNLRMVAAANNHKWADLIAYCDFPNVASTLVNTDDGSTWTLLDQDELAKLFTNMSGQKPTYYGDMLMQLRNYGGSWPNYPTPAYELAKRATAFQNELAAAEMTATNEIDMAAFMREYNRHMKPGSLPSDIVEPEAKAYREPKAKAEISAPSKPGATKWVWEIADRLYDPALMVTPKEFRNAVITACTESGINPGTAATQFGKWKTSKGL